MKLETNIKLTIREVKMLTDALFLIRALNAEKNEPLKHLEELAKKISQEYVSMITYPQSEHIYTHDNSL
jgi:hypothetical protein